MNEKSPVASRRRSSTADVSRLLEHKDEADILDPIPHKWECNGKVFAIKPMPDRKLMRVGSALSQTAEIVAAIADVVQAGVGGLSLAAYLPQIIEAIVPTSSKLIVAVLDVEEEWAEQVPLAKRIEFLKLVLLAEDAPLVLANFKELAAIFQPTPPAK